MLVKVGFIFFTLLVGSYTFPVEKKDMSIFFDHTDTSARIVGGTVAGRVPYMVALTAGIFIKGLMCGGSLITKKHVLTAAHCIEPLYNNGSLVQSLRGVVGTNRWNTGGTIYKFANPIIHSDYDIETIKNDIGLLITSTDVVMSDTVAVTTLNYDFIGGSVATTVTGWGRIITGGSTSPVLLQLNPTTLDGSYCVTEVAEKKVTLDRPYAPDVDPTIEICAFYSDVEGMCHGDSGSPLMRADYNEQIGIVSWGLPCAQGAPDMFARVSAYQSWIEQNIQ